MASSSYVKTLLGGLPAEIKTAVQRAFEYLIDRSLAFGPIDADRAQTQTTNFVGRYVKLTTSGTANQEVAVAHGLGKTPNVIWNVTSPSVVNSKLLSDVTVTRAADAQRLYLSSASTGVTTWIYCE